MKQEDQLFVLIKSLSKNEKGYFKKHASKHTDANNNSYVKLFNFIEKQKVFDEEKIKKQFSSDNLTKNFSASKNYLYHSIMKSLRSFHDDNSIDSIIFNLIKNVEILYRKTLFQQCESYLNKAEELAIKYDKRVFLMEINTFYYRLYLDQSTKKELSMSLIEEKYSQQKNNLHTFENIVDYQFLNLKFNFVINQISRDSEILNEISSSPLLRKNIVTKSKQASLLYYELLSSKEYYFNRDFNEALKRYTAYLEIFESNPLLIEQEPISYYFCLRNLMQSQLGLRKFNQFEKTIVKLESCIENDAVSKLKVHSTVIALKFMYYIFSNKTKEGIECFYVNEKVIKENSNLLNRSNLLAMYDSIALLFFFDSNYSKSLVYVNEILNDKSDLRVDLKIFATVLNLIIHYEMGNLSHISYILKFSENFIKKNTTNNSYAQPILKFMNRAVKSSGEKELKPDFITLYNELEKYKNEKKDVVIFNFFDLTLWPKSKILGVSLVSLKTESIGFNN